VKVILQKLHQKSLILLSRKLGNIGLEHLCFGLCGDSAADVPVMIVSSFTVRSRVSRQSVSNPLLLSIDALDDLLSSESFFVDSEEALLDILLTIGHPSLLRHIQWSFINTSTITPLCENPVLCHPTEPVWMALVNRLSRPPSPPIGHIDSLVVSDFPPLFEEFRMKRFNLLWRGSRDGFTAEEFHRRCDGHANTLTLILDTMGNVFGGFTPVEWEACPGGFIPPHNKIDESLQSFLFSLKNPHSVPPRKFVLKEEKKQYAIYCDAKCGPAFGDCIYVSDFCSRANRSSTHIGIIYGKRTYANDTNARNFLTGLDNFTVKEIEVFEITN
jgi:hypothetical protein